MTDIVERLRSPANVFYEYAADNGAFLREAADEIERLRDALRGVIRVADRKTVEFDAARAALGEIVCDCENGFRPSYHMGTGEKAMLECHKCKQARAALGEKE